MNIKYQTLIFFFCISFMPSLYAQPGSTTEAEVELQAAFIAASRDRILGKYEEAAEGYKAVLKKDPDNHAAAYELARVYDVMDEDVNALKSIQKAVSLEESNIWYKMFLADVLQKVQKHDDAVKIFEELIKNDPSSEYHHFKLAFALVAAQKPTEAIKVYDQMEKKFGLNEDTSSRKHKLYVGLGDNKKAAKEIQKLIDAFPFDVDYLHLLADFYESIGDTALSKTTYKKILEIDPDDAQAVIAVANNDSNTATSGNNDVVYLNSLKTIFQKEDESIDVKIKALIPSVNKVADFGDAELAQAATELAEILVNVHPNEAKAHAIYGDLLYHNNKPQEALKAYEKTLELDDNVYAVWEQVMYIHAESYDMDALIKTTEKAMDLFPNQAKSYYLNGIANIEQKNYKNAAPNLEQALMMSGKKMNLKVDILSKLGITYSELEKFEKAKKRLDQAVAIKADSYRVQDAMGWYYFQKADYDASKKWLDKSLKNGGEKDASVLEHYGDMLFQSGSNNKANQYWIKSKEQGGRSKSLLKKIANKKLG